MAKVIMKSRYTKQTLHISRYLEYSALKIETRPTVLNISGEELFSLEKHIGYVENRPGVEKEEKTGLFSQFGNVELIEALNTAEDYQDHTWFIHIISLEEEDAVSLGYHTREAWQHLISTKTLELAKALEISPENLVLFGAYHYKKGHPHIHLFTTSKVREESHMQNTTKLKQKTTKLKSIFLNTIFKEDVAHLKRKKQESIKDIHQGLLESIRKIDKENYPVSKEILEQSQGLKEALRKHKGRLQYMYLSPATKIMVNNYVYSLIENNPTVNNVFQHHLNIQKEFIKNYTDNPEVVEKKLADYKNRLLNPGKKDFTGFHNLVLKHIYLLEEIETELTEETPASYGKITDDSFSTSAIPPPKDDFLPEQESSSFVSEEITSQNPPSSRKTIDRVPKENKLSRGSNSATIKLPTPDVAKHLLTSLAFMMLDLTSSTQSPIFHPKHKQKNKKLKKKPYRNISIGY